MWHAPLDTIFPFYWYKQPNRWQKQKKRTTNGTKYDEKKTFIADNVNWQRFVNAANSIPK